MGLKGMMGSGKGVPFVERHRSRTIMAFSRYSKKSVGQLWGRAGDEAKAVGGNHSLGNLELPLRDLPPLRATMGFTVGRTAPHPVFLNDWI